MLKYEVDDFTSDIALAAFAERQAGVRQVVGALGLDGVYNEPPALLFAGSAAALQGLDTRIDGGSPFDVDAHISCRTLYRLEDEGWLGRHSVRQFHSFGRIAVGHIKKGDIALPVQLFCGEFGRDLNEALGSHYSGEVNYDITTCIAGVNVSKAHLIAQSKVRPYMRVKDVAGVIKAHVVGQHTGNPIVEEDAWQASVATAIRRVYQGDISKPLWRHILLREAAFPSWLRQLKERGFDHPALVGLK